MGPQIVNLSKSLRLERLSKAELALLIKYLPASRVSATLRRRLRSFADTHSKGFVKVKPPRPGASETTQRRNLMMFISGPIGGWTQKGRRIVRKRDQADWPTRIDLALLVNFQRQNPARLVYSGDLLSWWTLRLYATGQIRNLFLCHYCGTLGSGKRSTARFCNDRCRFDYHLALQKVKKLHKLPPGPRQKAFETMLRKKQKIGYLSMPIAKRKSTFKPNKKRASRVKA